MMKHIANIVTACRILGSVLLLFFPAFSVTFYMIYIICGVSDMIDGTLARMTNGNSEMGAKLDTVADFAFVSASLIKILPAIHLPQWVWIWGAGIAMIKIGTILWGYVCAKRFVSLHIVMNKITGLLLFLLPLTLSFIEVKYSSAVACSVATFSAIQEGVFVVTKQSDKIEF